MEHSWIVLRFNRHCVPQFEKVIQFDHCVNKSMSNFVFCEIKANIKNHLKQGPLRHKPWPIKKFTEQWDSYRLAGQLQTVIKTAEIQYSCRGFLGVSLGHPWNFLGASLGCPWGFLGASLGGSLGASLERPLGILGASLVHPMGASLWSPWGALRGLS